MDNRLRSRRADVVDIGQVIFTLLPSACVLHLGLQVIFCLGDEMLVDLEITVEALLRLFHFQFLFSCCLHIDSVISR